MNLLLANYPALSVVNPAAVAGGVNIELNEDKGYCRVGSQEITIRCFPRDKYEYIRNFSFGEADGEYFCNPVSAMITSSPQAHKVTYGFELGDVIVIEGKEFKLLPDHNNNIKLEAVR